MERFTEFLKKTECCFNWGLAELEVDEGPISDVEFFRKRLECVETVESQDHLWPVRLAYAYAMFKIQPTEGLRMVDEVIRELPGLTDSLTLKYRVPFFHIILSTKAMMLTKSGGDAEEIKNVLSAIKPKNDMSKVELSGLFAGKALMMRQYGPEANYKTTSLLREALRLNPQEAEWALSLVASQSRIWRYIKGRRITFDDVRESVSILLELLERTDLTLQQTVTSKYYLAMAYSFSHCRLSQMLGLCDEMSCSTDNPQILAFCADIYYSQNETHKSLEIIERNVRKFPTHIGINTTASKLYVKRNQFDLATKYAQIAMECRGYGAAWLLLKCKVALKEEFDEEAFFNRILTSYLPFYTTQSHVTASMYYFCHKRDVVRGAVHVENAMKNDPGSTYLHDDIYVYWIRRKVRPIELAYNQIVRFLKTSNNRSVYEAKVIIESVMGEKVFNFNTTDDLALSVPFSSGRSYHR